MGARGARRARGAAEHLGIELREYDARIRTFIPGYGALLTAAAAALKAAARAPRVVVDLGIGTGALAEACTAMLPRVRIVGIDEDEGMLAAARARLGRRLASTVHDDFERASIPRCDAVIASLALHHIPTPARRLHLFRRIRIALRPGGVFISADCHPPGDPRLAAAARHEWIAHLERAYTPAAARRCLRTWAREDHYATLSAEIAALTRAGFSVDVRARAGAFAVIAATR